MTSTDADDLRLSDYDEPSTSSGGRRRRRKRVPAPKANPFWRFLFPLVVSASVVLLRARSASTLILSNRARQISRS